MEFDSADRVNLKFVLLGDICVGKTSLSHRFVENSFVPNVESTVRIAFQSKNLTFQEEDGKTEVNLCCRIWDTAGQEKYRSLAPMVVRGADVAIVVYDVTRADSMDSVGYWLESLRDSRDDGQPPVIVVCGNKADAERDREVATEDGKMMADGCGAMFSETSARTGQGVEAIFVQAAKKAWERRKTMELKKQSSSGVTLGSDNSSESKCGC